MQLLLRRRSGDGQGETLDHELSGKTLRLGASARADFQLPGLQKEVRVSAGRNAILRLSCRTAALQRDGALVKTTTLAPGEAVDAGGYRFRAFAAPTGFDAGLEITGDANYISVLTAEVQRGIRPWSTRRFSWLAAGLILALFLILPFLAIDNPAVARFTSLPGIPDDRHWSSGELSSVHRAAGVAEDCSACHQKPFEMVRDGVCTDCHQRIREHADVHEFAGLDLPGERCAGCHREHNEPARLVRQDNPLCTDCHASPDAWRDVSDTELLAVHAFSADGHPEFRLSRWVPDGDGAAHGWRLQRTRAAPATLTDESQLKFNHEVHLDRDKVQTPNSREALACASCHVPKDSGEHFEPVRMDTHCRDCHSLNFDPFDPQVELPHGNTRAAFEALEAHFIREFTDPELRAERSVQKPRRLPGKRMGEASCEGSGLDCGLREAASEARYQFAETGCVTCHEVSDTGADTPIDRWFVHPVKLTVDWYSQSRFSHQSHLNLAGRSGDAICLDCHAADTSQKATDVLMPAKDNCLGCHDANRQSVAVDCVGCHQFHRPEGTPSVEVRDL
ncbi:cytochrome c3 family protein [Chromatocurvus halotolerans]|uniref:Putative CXXCH cytochrome family protein n=1 Tax=Chromatocurvus halotolerans TaxID=1132028 RepID=A0A4R2KH66_9GAMM|nr:cytochrome c3 family protein [Chromatocurvus halotolerans]TCO71762.1 putative CXXCH cytochrome family protein [Chromatocurvus halotolerans]